ncbi:MAG: GNAT family N-acetyltransferase [Gammaproteobacteria bacterium]
MEIRTVETLAGIPAAQWDRIAGEDYPFVRHAFLCALEEFDCLAPQGWHPMHLTAWDAGRLAGALPLYMKTNSIGEFVFDSSWAQAYERAGGRYYPKLVSAIPFTPVTGPRLLVDPGDPQRDSVRTALVRGAVELARRTGVSSLHCLFPDADDRAAWTDESLLPRAGCQYHWFNRGFAGFDAFLATLTSKRRKQIRHERREIAAAGVEIEVLDGTRVSGAQWARYHEFYCSTFDRHWGEPRLTLEFFRSLGRRMPAATVLILARRAGREIAGALALRGGDTLYGRHWGCSEHVPFLHFELCYYQTIDYCIRAGLARLDAGAQGEHKIARGFEPVRTWSVHWIRDRGFRAAVADFVERESAMVDGYVDEVGAHLPFRRDA